LAHRYWKTKKPPGNRQAIAMLCEVCLPIAGAKQKLIGTLDMMDLSAYTVKLVDKVGLPPTGSDSSTWDYMFYQAFQKKTVKELMSTHSLQCEYIGDAS
jgi:hypothetical protein